jgi:transglutaminase-like putative cysteine protease
MVRIRPGVIPAVFLSDEDSEARRGLTVPVAFIWIPGGRLGSVATLWEMRRLARRAADDPLTGKLLTTILSVSPPSDSWERARMIRDWLAAHVRFLYDPEGVSRYVGGPLAVDDYLRDPVTEQYPQLRRTGEIRGDCDDVAMLAAGLARAAKLPAVRFRVVSFDPVPPHPYSHVFTEGLTSRGWTEFDVTRRGAAPPVTRSEVLTV